MAKRRPPVAPVPTRPAAAPPGDAACAGLTVPVRVRPGASRTAVGGTYDGPHGPALIVAVSAPPVDGRATEAVRRALAAAFGVRPAAVALRSGATARDKTFTVAGADPARLTALLTEGPRR